MISFKQEDDILKVFSRNKYVGYVDETSMLYLFDRHQEPQPVKNIEDRAHIGPAYENWRGF